MAKIHETKIRIRSDHAQAVTGLKAVRKYAGKLVPSFSQVRTGALVMAAAVAGATAALFAMTKSTAEAYDKQQKLSDQLGVTTEFLSKMAYAAELSGIEKEKLNKHIGKFTVAIGEANRGLKTYLEPFQELDITLKNSNGQLKTAEELMPEVADRLSKIEDNTLKVNIAYKLFGQRGTEMLQLLNQGKDGMEAMWQEAETYGLVVSKEAGLASAAFNDSLTRLTGSITGTKNALGEDLMPEMTKFFNVSAQYIADHREDIIAMAHDWATTIAGIAESTIVGGAHIVDFFDNLSAAGRQVKIELMELKLPQLRKELAEMDAQWVDMEEYKKRKDIIDATTKELERLTKANYEHYTSASAVAKVEQQIAELRERLTNYVPPEIVPNVQEDPGALGGVTGAKALSAQREIDQLNAMWDQYYMTDSERLDMWFEEEFLKHADSEERKLQLYQIYQAKKDKLDEKAAKANLKFEQIVQNNKMAIQQKGWQLAFMMAGKNNKAVFAMQQGIAVAQIILATNTAAAAVIAPPPLGLGPMAGIPLAAAIKTSGYINAALTAALAIGQISGMGSTGDIPTPSGGGTYESPTVTTPAETAKTPARAVNITINVEGSLVDHAGLIEELAPFFEEAIEDKVLNINVT